MLVSNYSYDETLRTQVPKIRNTSMATSSASCAKRKIGDSCSGTHMPGICVLRPLMKKIVRVLGTWLLAAAGKLEKAVLSLDVGDIELKAYAFYFMGLFYCRARHFRKAAEKLEECLKLKTPDEVKKPASLLPKYSFGPLDLPGGDGGLAPKQTDW